MLKQGKIDVNYLLDKLQNINPPILIIFAVQEQMASKLVCMFPPKHLIIRRVSLLICFLLILIKLNSQCNPPDQLPTTQCVDAPVTCLNNACYSTSNMADPGETGFCGSNTQIHNPQYFEIIPNADCIQINIHVDDCGTGNALQSALVTSCTWQPCPPGPGGIFEPCADVLDCDPGTGVGGTMVIDACGLTPGVSLWLLIDGSSAAQCQYTITFAQGIFEPQIDEELMFGGANPGIVCQGFDDLIMSVGPPITNAHGYIWDIGWTGTEVTTTLPELQVDIENNAPVGVHDVCVLAFSGCDTSNLPYCFEVEIVEIDDVEKDPETFCPEEFPFSWQGVNIPGPGDYQATFETADGCPYDSTWAVEEYPDVPVGQIDTLYCLDEGFNPFIYEGENYDNAGTYELLYPNMGLNGCDSSAELNLTLVGIDAFIELSCDNGEFVLEVLIQELIPANGTVSYEWYDGGATPIWDLNPLLVTVGGCYEVIITVETPAGSCVFMLDQYCFDAAAFRPPAPNTNGDTLLCAQEGVIFEVIVDPFADPYTYEWFGPPGVDIWQNLSETVEMDFSFSTGGQVCVHAINECGEGPMTCFEVEIIPPPVASFNLATEICSDSITVVTFTGTAGPNAQFIWDFDSGASATGSGDGPFLVSWNIPGDKVVNLQVIEPGCDTAYASEIISVSNLLSPIINCSSTINSVNFDWDDVAGSNGYLVSINGNPPTATASSNYGLTGLSPGTQVIMTLTVVSGGPCDNIILMDTCVAENCPPPSIVLSGPDSLCLNAPAVITLDAQVNGSPGNGVWTGPGITNGNAGTFDPTISGSGLHQVIYTVDVGGCSFSDSYLMTVFDSITADFIVDPLICVTDVANVTYMGNASGGATYLYDFGAATVVSGSGAGPYQISYSSPGPKSVRLQITENGCASDVITQNLNVSPTLNAPVVNCQPTTSTVTFSWTDDNPGGYIVNILSGHAGVTMIPEVDFLGLVPGDSVVIEIISLSTGPCPIRKDTFSCVARTCPIVGFLLTPVPGICLYAGTSPFDLEVIVTGGNGVGDWSGPGITDPAKGTFDPMIAGAGAHVITFHYLDDGCDFYEPLNINISDPPVAFISNTSLVLTCGGGNILLLDGSGSSGGTLTYEWTTADGFINFGQDQDKAEVAADGTYQLKVIDASGCVDSTSVVVTEDANTPDAVAGPDRTITCDSTTFVLGNGSSTGPNIIYSWTTPNGNIIGSSTGITITVGEVGDYTIAVRDTVNGCQSFDIASVTIDTATANITLTPGDTIDCNTSLSGVASVLSGPLTDYDLVWSTVDGSISGATTSQNIDVSQGGTYTLTITNKNNGCEKTASAFVAESDEIIDAVDVRLTNVVCFGDDNGTLTIMGVTGGSPPYTYQWSVGDLTSLSSGQYSLTVSDQNGCSFTQVYTITEPPKVTADVGPDFTAAAGDSVTINLITNLDINAISDIDWTGIDGVDCPGCPSLQLLASSSGTVVALVTDTAGCSAIDSMRLTVIVPRIIFIPTIFSPNDDGINDHFFISGKRNLVMIPYLRVYDRWGNQVFERIDGTPGVKEDGWDGKFNGGQFMLPGVYVYSAKLLYEDGEEEIIKGGITIIR